MIDTPTSKAAYAAVTLLAYRPNEQDGTKSLGIGQAISQREMDAESHGRQGHMGGHHRHKSVVFQPTNQMQN
jgi:hypothetical protein